MMAENTAPGAVLLRQVKGFEIDANTLVNILKVGGLTAIQFKGMPADARMVGFVQDALEKNKVVLIIESKEFPLVGATGKLQPLKVEAQTIEIRTFEPATAACSECGEQADPGNLSEGLCPLCKSLIFFPRFDPEDDDG